MHTEQGILTASGSQRKHYIQRTLPAAGFKPFSESADSRCFKQVADAEFDSERFTNAAHQLYGEKRMPAKFEKSVINTDSRRIEDF